MDAPSTPPTPALSLSDFDEENPHQGAGHVRSGPDPPFSKEFPATSDLNEPQLILRHNKNHLMALRPPACPSLAESPLLSDKLNVVFYSSALELESQLPARLKAARRKPRAGLGSLSPLTTSRPKKTPRRKSRTASEAFLEGNQGGGYTSTPATGKIFRNLLILEESLRQQVAQQRTLRRKYMTFLAALLLVIASISYHLYFGRSNGYVQVFLQLLWLLLVVTLLLYHLLGEYQKTIVLPRKFLLSTNKGLRQLNVRLVKTRSSFTNRAADLARELGLFLCTMALNFCHAVSPLMIRNPNSRLEIWLVSGQLRCQPRFGLNDVKLVLVPRSFNTDIREGWELYRDEFWIKEGIRRRDYLLDFTRPAVDEKRAREKRNKRKLSVALRPSLSEHNLDTLDSLSPEPTPPEM